MEGGVLCNKLLVLFIYKHFIYIIKMIIKIISHEKEYVKNYISSCDCVDC